MEFCLAGRKHRLAMPMLVSWPVIANVSFRLIGRPWRGPSGREWVVRWVSRSRARVRASWKNISVRQFVCGWTVSVGVLLAYVQSRG